MFESTLEAQGLNVGERRLGTLSAAALAHVGIGLTIVAVTALIVPPVDTPEPPLPPLSIIAVIPRADPTPRPAPAPAPRRGTDTATPARALAPPPVAPDVPPHATPDTLPEPVADTAPSGPEGTGEGTPGDPNGSQFGIPGAAGDADAGAGAGSGGEPLEVTGDMVRPKLLEKVSPSYPLAARRAGLGGRVTVRAVIAPDGSVESVEVVNSTNRLFDDAAVDAVRRWRYRPALMNGRPVRVYFSVVVDFLVR
jgi:protein TonB